jgi:hypothetical protein
MKTKKHGYILVLCFLVVFWGMIVEGYQTWCQAK